MTSAFQMPSHEHYWLRNGHISASLLDPALCPDSSQLTSEGLTAVHLEIQSGQIKSLATGTVGTVPTDTGIPEVDLRGGMVWPCFVDVHTHLDKGHIWPRQPNTAGTFENACEAVWTDRSSRWTEEDVYARMSFGLRCSYAHGTQAIRTHIDSINGQGAISLRAFVVLQQEWQGRIQLQASSLIPAELYGLPEGEAIADLFAATPGGILGALPEMGPGLDAQLDRIMRMAMERGLDLDFHTDESGDPSSITLRHVAQA
ncbi:MAG: amidohydrolase family protein, partial [Synechococcaceae cyanobacterium SM2_3_2]|nr:amidohydrolase family protein [Synechococcaceae cyanobacterium SM2_3_2]